MALLELEFLREIGRLRVAANDVFHSLHAQVGLRVDDRDFAPVGDAAMRLSWTRDPFDRVIVGHASSAGVELLTRDDTIRDHFERAIW